MSSAVFSSGASTKSMNLAGVPLRRLTRQRMRRSRGLDVGFVMLIIARTLAVLSVLLTLAVIEILRLGYLPIGFEATLVLGGYSFWLAIVTAVSALVIVIVRARLGRRAGFAPVAFSCAVCLLALALLLADFFVEAWWRSS